MNTKFTPIANYPLYLFVLFFLVNTVAHGATINAVASTNWNNPATWDAGIPGAGDDVIINGFTVTVTANAACTSVTLNSNGGSDTGLQTTAGTLTISGDMLLNQTSGGRDMYLNLNGSGIINVVGNYIAVQSSGDDMGIAINISSGTTAQLNVAGNMSITHSGGDNNYIQLDEANSLLTVGGNFTSNMTTGGGDLFLIDLNDGDFNVTGNFSATRADNFTVLSFDLDGGNLNSGDMIINSSGNAGDGRIDFIIDENSIFTAASLDVTMSGGDDFNIWINDNGGTTGKVNITGACTVNRSGGDDIQWYLMENGSELNIGTNLAITSTGGEELIFEMNNTSLFTVGGNFTIDNSDSSGDDFNIDLNGGNFTVTGNTAVTTTADAEDITFDLNGGNFSTIDLTMNSGGLDDMELFIDDGSVVTVTGNLAMTHSNGDDFKVYLGDDGGATVNQLLVTGNASYTKAAAGGDDFDIICNDVASTLTIGGDYTGIYNGDADEFTINMDEGVFTVTGSMDITAATDYDIVYFDIDGGIMTIGDLTVDYTGRDDFYIDLTNASTATFNSIDANMNSGDKLEFEVNNSAVFTVTNNVTVDHNAAADNVDFDLNNTASMNIGGDCIITTDNGGGDVTEIDLANNAAIVFSVGGDLSMTFTGAGDDLRYDQNGGTATIGGNFTLRMDAGDDLQANLDNNTGSLAVTGNMTLDHNGGDDAYFYLGRGVGSPSLTVGGDFSLDHSAGDFTELELNNSSTVDIDGDFILNATAGDEARIDMNNSSVLFEGGSFIRGAAPNSYGDLNMGGNTTLHYDGVSGVQVFSQDAGDDGDGFDYENVVVNNTFGTSPQLTMEGLATIQSSVVFTSGVISSTSANILVIEDGASTAGASNASFVDGYVRKEGRNPGGEFTGTTEGYAFPVGANGLYSPIYITRPGSSTDAFDATYIAAPPHDTGFDTSLRAGTIHHISSREYWLLSNSAGSPSVKVSLSWEDLRSGGVDDLPQLKVAHWQGGTWTDEGNGYIPGSATSVSGLVQSFANIGTFSPFTLSSGNIMNPLPVELISFDAKLNGDKVDLTWETASEINSDYFLVERSKDGITWDRVLTMDGAGNSVTAISYMDVDYSPLKGVSYYRLTQFDFDGGSETFNIVPVEYLGNNEPGMHIFPNPVSPGDQTNIQLTDFGDAEILVVLRDITGKQFYSKVVIVENGDALVAVDIDSSIPAGTYLVTASSENKLYSRKLIIQASSGN